MDDLAVARRHYRYLLFVVAAILIALLIDSELSPTALITPVPWAVKGPAIGSGMVAGLALSLRVAKQNEITGRQASWRNTVGLLSMPLLLAPVGSYVGRRGFEMAAFAGEAGQPAGTIEAAISSSWRKRSMIALEIEPSLRDLDVHVDYRADYSAIGRFCLTLPVEQGKFGAKRTRLPTIMDEPVHLDTFQPCSPSVLERNPRLAERVARIEARAAK